MCWPTVCSALIASSFRILSSSTGIPSPPLASLAAILPETHLTSHSRMSGSRWVTTSWWLSRSLRAFLYSSVSSWHFLASLLLLGPLLCVFYGANPCMKCSLVPPIFLKRSVVFPILLSSSTSLHCSLKKTFSSLLFSETLHSVGCIFPFLPCLSLLFFAWLVVKPPQTTTLPSCIFLWDGFCDHLCYNVTNLPP